jgi:hypothetical protein
MSISKRLNIAWSPLRGVQYSLGRTLDWTRQRADDGFTNQIQMYLATTGMFPTSGYLCVQPFRAVLLQARS